MFVFQKCLVFSLYSATCRAKADMNLTKFDYKVQSHFKVHDFSF